MQLLAQAVERDPQYRHLPKLLFQARKVCVLSLLTSLPRPRLLDFAFLFSCPRFGVLFEFLIAKFVQAWSMSLLLYRVFVLDVEFAVVFLGLGSCFYGRLFSVGSVSVSVSSFQCPHTNFTEAKQRKSRRTETKIHRTTTSSVYMATRADVLLCVSTPHKQEKR
jgi:hypothetical protein